MSDNTGARRTKSGLQAAALWVIGIIIIAGLVAGYLAVFTDRLSAAIYLPAGALCIGIVIALVRSKRIWGDDDAPTEGWRS